MIMMMNMMMSIRLAGRVVMTGMKIIYCVSHGNSYFLPDDPYMFIAIPASHREGRFALRK